MARNHHNQLFEYPHLLTATVKAVNPVNNPKTPTTPLSIDALPINNAFFASGAAWFCQPGITRLPRKGMQVGLMCVNGSAQFAMALGHVFNNEPDSAPAYQDPLPPSMEYPDDLVIHHEETSSFIRWRNQGSSATTAGPDASPLELSFQSLAGANFTFSEYLPPGYPPPPPEAGQPLTPPPPPTRAKLDILMPSGAEVTIDEPDQGQATLNVTMPSGATIVIDENGVITLTAPETVNIVAPTVNVGDSSGTQELAFKSDVQTLVDALNTHVHGDVANGVGISGQPSMPLPDPVGTTQTFAV